MATTIQPKMETMAISLPRVDLKKIKAIAKAMGWTIEKMDYYNSPQFYAEIDKAEEAIKNGEGVRVTNAQELDALFL